MTEPRLGLSAHLYLDVHEERVRAHEKHAPTGGTMETRPWDDSAWLPVLLEEVGEVAAELCEHNLGNQDRTKLRAGLRTELVQVAAMACAWIAALDGGDTHG